VNEEPAPLGSPQLRLLLAALLVHADAVVPADQIAEIIWGDDPPASASGTVQKLIYRLRGLIGGGSDESSDEVVTTRAPGYVLHTSATNYDARRFAILTADAQQANRRRAPHEALPLLDEALDLWRGAAFEEFASEEFARAEAVRLDELRLLAIEERADAKLSLGEHSELVGELESLVSAHPYRERVWGQLMLALYRTGRQAEALRAYTRLRELLADGLGIAPGTELRDLEQAILAQSPDLDLAPRTAPDRVDASRQVPHRSPAPPSGTVTFLFTDVEGSTRLWDEYPEEMRTALARHDEILREAVERHDGHLVKTTGDGLHAVFGLAHDGVAAALDAQRALVAENWTLREPLRVRMGLHTGGAELRDGDYYGPTVNRAARVSSAAHGGQVLVSHATQELVQDELPEGTALVDLGEHLFRGLTRAERAFQLAGVGLDESFPPLQTLAAHPGNLPEPLTSFVGREYEREVVTDALHDARIVTLTGVGGVGKTRLATHVAAAVLTDYPDGAWLCELATATDERSLHQVVAAVLAVQPRPGLSVDAAIGEFVRAKRLLLVLDNCEHLLDECGRLAETMLRSCPNLRILATSREGLGTAGERVIAVRSLAVPDPSAGVELLEVTPASRLFLDRAGAVRADFGVDDVSARAVAEICRRLDGIPLAIELAAARAIAMRPAEIAALLDQRFRLLTGGQRVGVERHQTLRATVEWSYSLLAPHERVVFDRLGIFPGGFDAAAATKVVATDGLEDWDVRDAVSSLVAKSMLGDQEAGDGTTRYRLLETLRQYALERLDESSDLDLWRRRHAEHYADWAETSRPGLLGPDELVWLARFDAESDNLRAAAAWSLAQDTPRDLEVAIRLVAMLPHTALSVREFGAWADQLTERVESTTPGRRSDVLAEAALWNALVAADAGRARLLALRAIQDGVEPDANGPHGAYTVLAITSRMEGRMDEAMQWLADGQRAVADLDKPFANVALSATIAMWAASTGNYERARTEADRAVALARRLGQPTNIGLALVAAGTAWERDDPQASLAAFEEAIAIRHTGADRGEIRIALTGTTRARIAAGDIKGAVAEARDGIAYYHHAGLGSHVVALVNETIFALAAAGEPEVAAVLAGVVAAGRVSELDLTFNPERLEAVLTRLRDEIGPESYATAFAQGEAMSADDAVAFALAELERVAVALPQP
jgi:predicted ATPase/class 3 adenylate cyclase/DNA-binding winged helix-turn-helix (wHTH) protein